MARAGTGTLLATFALAAVVLFVGRWRKRPLAHPKWLSLASGVAVAYVFIDLLPHLAEHQGEWLKDRPHPAVHWLNSQVYLAALVGVLIMHGVEQLSSHRGHHVRSFYVHLATFGFYNAGVGFFFAHVDRPATLALSTLAFAAHFAINTNSLRREDQERCDRVARPILAASVMLGWALGTFGEPPLLARTIVFAFLAGVIILTSLSEELPEARAGGFTRFAFGAAAFSLLLLALNYVERIR